MKKITILLVFLGLLGIQAMFAQKDISGTITSSEDGEVLPGVSVIVKGTTIGTITDFNGTYTLSVPDDAEILVYSFVGMLTQEVPIGESTTIDIVLQPDVEELEEVVVIAYGTKPREGIVGSVEVVRSDKIESKPLSSIDKIMQGNVAGLQSMAASGQPGSASDIRIRGIGSFTNSNSPLYVIDGVPMTSSTLARNANTDTRDGEEHSLSSILSTLNPNDIESISVLKDATSASIYGSRASNGVILITTKKGKQGETQFMFRSQYGFSNKTKGKLEMLNATEFVTLYREALLNDDPNIDLSLYDLSDTSSTDWMEEAFGNNAITQSYELSARGGTEKTTFYTSLSYFNQEGVALGSEFERFSGRINLVHAATEKLNFGTNVSLSNAIQQSPLTSSGYFISPVVGAYTYRPNVPARNPDGTPYFDEGGISGGASFIGVDMYNEDQTNTMRSISNIFGEYAIIPDLKFKTSWGVDFNDVQEHTWDDPRNPGNTAEGIGRVGKRSTRLIYWTTTNTLNYHKLLSEVHDVDVLLGHEAVSWNKEMLDVEGENFPNEKTRTLSSAAEPVTAWGYPTEFKLLSYFSRLTYNYNGKYYVVASFRRDGSSRFGADNKFANFYSVGGKWRISEEDFLSGITAIDELSVRTGYGTSGNQELLESNGAPNNYGHQGLYGFGRDYIGNPGMGPQQIENNKLKWEEKSDFNIAVDFRVLRRFSGTIEIYNMLTTDLIMSVPVSRTTGFDSFLDNVGEMTNKGIEATLSADVLTGDMLNWSIDFNISHNKNEIKTLYNKEDIIDGTKIRREGEAYQTFYMAKWAGVNPTDGAPLWYDEDGNVVTEYTLADKVIVGTADPKFHGGFTNNFGFKGIELSVFFQYVYGNKIYNNNLRIIESDGFFLGGANQSRAQLDRWQKPGDITDVPKLIAGGNNNSNQMSTRWLEDGSYIRLKNITLGYNLPSAILENLRLSSVRIYAQGVNLWTRTNYKGDDPEQALIGTSWFVYPQIKTITFGLDVGF